jgi:hypothetical protein
VIERAFGRRPQFDERSRLFNVRSLADQLTPRSYTWRVPEHLDQGSEGSCVGFGFAHELAAQPVSVKNVTTRTAHEIYWSAQHDDPWPGGAYPGASPLYEGTSVLAGATALRALGHYREYRWAFSEPDVAVVVGRHGPVVIGVNWYTGMMSTDASGFIRPTGVIEGGHCTLLHGISLRGDRYSVWQSWGSDWGLGGRAFIWREDLARLLAEDGDACVPVRKKLPVVTV